MTTWVLLRGLGREARHWGEFPARLQAALPAGHVTLALDLPGLGRHHDAASPSSLAGMVEAARRELATLPHRPPCVFVALSLGGMVAQEWMRRERRQVAGCVLINTSVAGLSPPWRRLRPGALARMVLLARPGLTVRERERRILALTSNRPVDEAVLSTWTGIARMAPVTRANLVRQLAAASLARAARERPTAPTLLLASRHDRIVHWSCSQRLAARWGMPLATHPWAGHDLPLDDPDWVVTQIVAWWDLQAR